MPPNVEVVNPRQYVAHVNETSNIEMEFLIARGQSYVKNATLNSIAPSGFLSVDAVFMPVKKVNFFVETAQQNKISGLESLILEIWTNGSISPDEALSLSAETLENSFKLLRITNTTSTFTLDQKALPKEENVDSVETIFIEELELNTQILRLGFESIIFNIAVKADKPPPKIATSYFSIIISTAKKYLN